MGRELRADGATAARWSRPANHATPSGTDILIEDFAMRIAASKRVRGGEMSVSVHAEHPLHAEQLLLASPPRATMMITRAHAHPKALGRDTTTPTGRHRLQVMGVATCAVTDDVSLC